MWVQILVVVIVAIVFLVRLVAALYDQPSKAGDRAVTAPAGSAPRSAPRR